MMIMTPSCQIDLGFTAGFVDPLKSNRIFPAQEAIFEDCDQQPVLRVVLTFLWHGIQFLGPRMDNLGHLRTIETVWPLFDVVSQRHLRWSRRCPCQVSSHFGWLELWLIPSDSFWHPPSLAAYLTKGGGSKLGPKIWNMDSWFGPKLLIEIWRI